MADVKGKTTLTLPVYLAVVEGRIRLLPFALVE